MINVRDAMRQAAQWHGNRIAVVCGDRELTFKKAWDRGLRFANALLKLGLEPQDRVAVLEENGLENAKALDTHIERMLMQTPDHTQWQMEEPVTQNDPAMAELPQTMRYLT